MRPSKPPGCRSRRCRRRTWRSRGATWRSICRPPEQLPAWVAGFWEAEGDYYPARKIPAGRPCHGREEIVAFFTEWLADWEGMRYVVKEARAIGDDRVLVHGLIRAEGRSSGMTLEGEVYSCFWLRNGRFFRAEGHLTLAHALRALGLSGDSLEAAGLSD